MPTGHETEEFEKFVQNLVRPPAGSAAPFAAAPQITIINRPQTCRIYIGGDRPPASADDQAKQQP